MKRDLLFGAIITLIWIVTPKTVKANRRLKRGNTENFNVLLSIYKMNPLKNSNVFQTFSNHILLPGPDEPRTAMNYNLNESHESREKENSTNTELIEGLINHAPHKSNEHPLYSYVEDDTSENFEPGNFLNKLVSINQIDYDSKGNDYSDIFKDDLVPTNTTQAKQLNNYVNTPEYNIKRGILKKLPTINRNSNILGKVNSEVPSYIKETIVLK